MKRVLLIKNFCPNMITVHNFYLFFLNLYCIQFCVILLDLVSYLKFPLLFVCLLLHKSFQGLELWEKKMEKKNADYWSDYFLD